MDDTGFGIYFTLDNTRLRLPVNPQEITVNYDGDNTNYNVAGLGEVVVPRLGKLATIEIESLFPRNSFNGLTVSNTWYKPEYYVNFFRYLQKNKSVFQLIINRRDNDEEMFDTNIKAVVTSFKITDKGGEAGDLYYSLSLQEYRDAEPKKLEIVSVDEANSTTYLTENKQRPTDNTELCVGDAITVTGPVYEQAEPAGTTQKRNEKIGYLRDAKCVVGRVLPPQLQAAAHGIYATGVGWIDKKNCIKGNVTQSKYGQKVLAAFDSGTTTTDE